MDNTAFNVTKTKITVSKLEGMKHNVSLVYAFLNFLFGDISYYNMDIEIGPLYHILISDVSLNYIDVYNSLYNFYNEKVFHYYQVKWSKVTVLILNGQKIRHLCCLIYRPFQMIHLQLINSFYQRLQSFMFIQKISEIIFFKCIKALF